MLTWVRSKSRLRSRSEDARADSADARCSSALHTSCLKVVANLQQQSLQVGPDTPIMNDFSIFDTVPAADREELIKHAQKDPRCKRAMGAMVGMAVADSVGHMFEFLPVGDKGSHFDRKTLKVTGELNRFKLKPGQWTDDAAMGLCMADSLLVRGGYDGSDIRVRFWSWWNRGYNNAFRHEKGRTESIGLGGNISMSLMAIHDGSPPPRFVTFGEDAGNGSLMRLAPVPIYFHHDIKLASRMSAESSYTTHPGNIAADAASFLSFVIVRAITRQPSRASAAQFLDKCAKDFAEELEGECPPALVKLFKAKELPNSPERCWNWRDAKGPYLMETIAARGMSYNGYPVSPGYFGAFSMDGLAIALHCFYHTSSFMEAIAKCINFLGDADSTGSICAQMAGAFYGLDAVDRRLVERLEQWDRGEIALRAALLYGLGTNLGTEVREAALRAAEAPNPEPAAFQPLPSHFPMVDEPSFSDEAASKSKAEKTTVKAGGKAGKRAGKKDTPKTAGTAPGDEKEPHLSDAADAATTASSLNTMSPPTSSQLQQDSDDVADADSDCSDYSSPASPPRYDLRCCSAARSPKKGSRSHRCEGAQILPAMAPLPARSGKTKPVFPDGVLSL